MMQKAFDALWDLDPYEDNFESKPFIPDADLGEAIRMADEYITMKTGIKKDGNSLLSGQIAHDSGLT